MEESPTVTPSPSPPPSPSPEPQASSTSATSPDRVVHRLTLPPDLYDYQLDFIGDPSEELATVSCPQVGKTEGTACWLLRGAWRQPETTWWWAGPTYRQVEDGYFAMKRVLRAGQVPARFVDHKYVIRLPNGSLIECRSWDDPDNLSGRTVHGMALDEAHGLTKAARTILDMRRASTLGPVRYNGNATGEGSEWEELWTELEREGKTRRWTWHDRHRALLDLGDVVGAAAYEAWILKRKARLPESEYQRVYEAVWAVSEESIFGPYVDRVFVNKWDDAPHEGHPYVIPVDVGLVDDFTVATPICQRCLSASWSYSERGNSSVEPPAWTRIAERWGEPVDPRLAGPKLEHRLARIAERFNRGTIVVERNGPGQKLLNDIFALWPHAEGWWTDELSKRDAILEWVALAKDGRLTLPADPATIREHRRFRSIRQKSGPWVFRAPDGEHDDKVMSTVIGVGHLTTGGAAFVSAMERETMARRLAQQKAAGVGARA